MESAGVAFLMSIFYIDNKVAMYGEHWHKPTQQNICTMTSALVI
jgi:hypothetical protein